jgi:predicted RNase H-like HicB family nuclease
MENVQKFKVYLEYDAEYGGFIADVPTLPGCMSQGKSEKDALKNIEEAIRGYLKVIKKRKKKIPSETIRYVTVGA